MQWDEVAGQEAAKAALKEAVTYPILYPQFFSGKRKPSNGVLLYGPPGTGKTHLARVGASPTQLLTGNWLHFHGVQLSLLRFGRLPSVLSHASHGLPGIGRLTLHEAGWTGLLPLLGLQSGLLPGCLLGLPVLGLAWSTPLLT